MHRAEQQPIFLSFLLPLALIKMMKMMGKTAVKYNSICFLMLKHKR